MCVWVSEWVSVNLSRCQQGYRIEREGYALAVSHGRPGISQQVSGVALPYTERKVNVDIKCQRQWVQHICLTYIHVCIYPGLLLTDMYYKSMPLVFTPLWLLCIGVRRAKSGPISSAIYLRTVLCSYLVPLQQRLARYSTHSRVMWRFRTCRVAVKRHYDDRAAYHVRKFAKILLPP